MKTDQITAALVELTADELSAVTHAVLKEITRRMYDHTRKANAARRQIANIPNPKNEITLRDAVLDVLKRFGPQKKKDIVRLILKETSFKTKANDKGFARVVANGTLEPLVREKVVACANRVYSIKG